MSLGLAVFPEDGDNIPTLIQRADQALYQAKRQGRNRMMAWSAKMEGEEAKAAPNSENNFSSGEYDAK